MDIELVPLCVADVAWLNVVQAVGQGDLDGNHLVYEIYEVR